MACHQYMRDSLRRQRQSLPPFASSPRNWTGYTCTINRKDGCHDVSVWRSNLLFIGIPEMAETNDIFSFMRQMVPQLLGEANFSSPPVMERCHCIGVKDNSRTKGPRPILLKFHYYQDKLKLMKLSMVKTEFLLYERARVCTYLDFTTGLVQKCQGFDEAKTKLRDRGINTP